MKDWMKTQLWSIMHLIDKNGNLLELDEFNAKYYQIYTVKNMKVTLNIPVVLQSIKNNLNDTLSLKLHHIKTDCGFCKQKCNNRFLKKYLINILHPGVTRKTLDAQSFGKTEIWEIGTKFLVFPVPLKGKDAHFKTINDIYPSNEFIRKKI